MKTAIFCLNRKVLAEIYFCANVRSAPSKAELPTPESVSFPSGSRVAPSNRPTFGPDSNAILGSPGPAIPGLLCHRVQMRLVKYFKGEADADGAGHFDADNVCSIALLKNGPTRSHVDMRWSRARACPRGLTMRNWIKSSMGQSAERQIERAEGKDAI